MLRCRDWTRYAAASTETYHIRYRHVFISPILPYLRLENVTNCSSSVTFAIDVVFFAPAFERCLADGPHSKKTVGTRKELVSKQAHFMWGRADMLDTYR